MKKHLTKLFIITSLVIVPLLGLVASAGVYFFIVPKLPSIEILKDMRLQVPLRVYTRDGKLLAEFGEKKRSPVRIEQTPDLLIKAFLAAEDDRFYEHPGVDYQGILRAVYLLVKTGEKSQGGSTITMQVARNFFLSSEKTYFRKINEILLALKIERELSKQEILELYLNKIYLGNRAYGVGAAAQVYYGEKINELTLAQIAMIAGLPKAPSAYNPIANPERALLRRNYVLRRMHELGFIDDQVFSKTLSEGMSAKLHSLSVEVEAPYVAEMVRAKAVEAFGNDAYTAGYKVYTTIDSTLQIAANDALHKSLEQYDRRHGYRGAEQHVDLDAESTEEQWKQILRGFKRVVDLEPGLVIALEEKAATVYLDDQGLITIDWAGMDWAKPYIDENRMGRSPKSAADILKVGDVVRVQKQDEDGWRLTQIPQVEGALVSISPEDGGINALVGGFDYSRSKFNRVLQAERQPGSNFKPFIYSAALENGFTTASLINDAPVVFNDPGLEAVWRPENYSGKFYGPTRLRQGLINSRNLISIRLLRAIGIRTALKHVAKFGFHTEHLPHDLSLSLGSGAITPLELVRGYAVFANGGYRVEPYFIVRMVSPEDETLFQAEPATVCRICEEKMQPTAAVQTGQPEITEYDPQFVGPLPFFVPQHIAPRVINKQNIYLMTSMMRDVIKHGTGRRARRLGRNDLAGKTGTTNDQRDAWFSGFNGDVVTTVWVGFDTPQPLGNRETGSRAALPMWIDFMRVALRGLPETELDQPPGLVTVRIDPKTGQLAGANNRDAIFETFRVKDVPKRKFDSTAVVNGIDEPDNQNDVNYSEQLF